MKMIVDGDDCEKTKENKATENTTKKKNILHLLHASLLALKNHEEELNKLNVYPVPDGDTGTNMVLTMQNVLSEAVKVGDNSLVKLAPAIIYGSLMGARGNSGVILSQIIRGICEELGQKDEITAKDIACAIKNGAATAYQAVKKPVEGTMLTVIKDMANAAEKVSGNGISPEKLLDYVIEEGKKSVERTPTLLPILKEAGVVDAGGYGLVVIAQGIASYLKGHIIQTEVQEELSNIIVVEEDIKYAYCTEFILKSSGVNFKEIEKQLEPLGDSLLVVGSPTLTKIHIHTNRPGEVLNIATDLGSICNVEINNIIEQSETRAKTIAAESALEQALKPLNDEIGLIAVANGDGINQILLSLGVHKIINGGQSMNPSTADLVKAVNELPHSEIIILPNNKNIIMTAQQVTGLTDKTVRVIPTKSIPEAFTALTAYTKDLTIDKNVIKMTKSLENVKTGEITYAVRDDANGTFNKNDYIGLFNGEIKTTGKEFINTAINLLKIMIDDNDELITLLTGSQLSNDDINNLINEINKEFPGLDVDFHHGNQPIYHLIIGVE